MKRSIWSFFKRCPKSGKVVGLNKSSVWYGLFFPLLGLIALLWFLIRVVPKPSRAAYPCQQVAAPLALGFLGSFAAGAGIIVLAKKIINFVSRNWLSAAKVSLLMTAFLIPIGSACVSADSNQADVVSSATVLGDAEEGYQNMSVADKSPSAMTISSQGQGMQKVSQAHDASATTFDGRGFWWSDESLSWKKVDAMLAATVLDLTESKDLAEAWDRIFKNFQTQRKLPALGYQAGEKIVIKLNLNGINVYERPGNASFTSPQFVIALLKQLVINAGVPAADITIFDATRMVPDIIYDRLQGVLAGVRAADFKGEKGRIKVEADLSQPIVWSETSSLEKKRSPAYLPTIVTEASYMINLSSLKGHDLAGFTATAKNQFGTLMSGGVAWAPDEAGIHPTIAALDYHVPGYRTYAKRSMGTYNAIVDLMLHKHVGGKTLLYLLDGMYSVNEQNSPVRLVDKWQQPAFAHDANGSGRKQPWWPSLVIVSQDASAIDWYAYELIKAEPGIRSLKPGHTATNYLVQYDKLK